MAIAYRSAGVLSYGSRANSTINKPSGTADGDLLIAQFVLERDGSAHSATPPAGWTLLDDFTFDAFSAYYRTYLYWKIAGGSEPSSYTWTHTTGLSSGLLVAYSGVNASTPFDVAYSRADKILDGPGDATAIAPSITTVTADTMLLTLRTSWDGNTVSPTSGWSERVDSTVVYAQDRTQAVAGATGTVSLASGNASARVPWVIWQIALRPAGDDPEHKTSSTSISLGLTAGATAAKHAASGVALDLDLSTEAGQAKHAETDAALPLLLALAAQGEKTAQSTAALDLLTGIVAESAKTGSSSVGLDVLLGLDATAAKTGSTTAGIPLGLTLVGHTSEQPPEHKTATASLAVGLTIDALAGKHAEVDTLIGLSVALDADASKTGVAAVPMGLVLDAIAHAAKTAGAAAALDLALTIAASRTQPLRDITLCATDRRPELAAVDRRPTLTGEDRRPTLLAEDRSVPCHA